MKLLARLSVLTLFAPLAVLAADAAHFPAQVTTGALQMTGVPFATAHFPAIVTTSALTMTGTPFEPARFPASVQTQPLQMTGKGGS